MAEPVFRDDPYAASCRARVAAVDERGIRLDRTVFYARGGGQPGDVGVLEADDGTRVAIVDTVRGDSGEVIHVPADDAPALAPGVEVTARIDWARRHRLMRMHSSLHLLSALVPGAVTGGQVGADKSRLDFDLPEGGLDKQALTDALNRLIADDLPLVARWISEEELAAQPELVKTMSVAPPRGAGRVRLVEIEGTDLQACGGTHVARTGEIGRVRITKIENKGRHNRRVTVALADDER
jgi:misacylated tRNA(Ala) deacylase